ncbi:hypothetical protein [Longispora albida]|uniref:hypothetical protein n=1 Tax=Longispora albida TaxID=203523 RepID=UPI00068707AF|nr:hypothetical protein [Longispora albida]
MTSGPWRSLPGPPGTRTEIKIKNRSFILYEPEERSPAVPLVLVLHGGFGSTAQAEGAYGWNEAASSTRTPTAPTTPGTPAVAAAGS